MNFGKLFKESLEIVRYNIIIIIPPLTVFLIMTVLTHSILNVDTPAMGEIPVNEEPMGTTSPMEEHLGTIFFLAIVNYLLQVFSLGMMISMGGEAIRRDTCSLKEGFSLTLSRSGNLIIAAVILFIVIAVGMFLFILPGIIVLFLFMFTFIIIITEDYGAIDSLKRSFTLVKENLSNSLLLFISIVGMFILLLVINMILVRVPYLGQIVYALLLSVFLAFLSISLLKFYKGLGKGL